MKCTKINFFAALRHPDEIVMMMIVGSIGTYDILRQLVSGQVLDVLVCAVDDFGEFLAVDSFLEHVHGDPVVEVRQPLGVEADDLGDGRAPVEDG